MKKEFELNVPADTTLYGYIYEPKNFAKGILLICHGMAEHIERYDEFMEYVSNNGYICVGYNQRGHGKTAGTVDNCGYMDDVDNFKVLAEDVDRVNKYVKNIYPDLPLFLLGHSMGSFVSQRYIQLYGANIDGVILSGSSLNTGLKYKLGKSIASIITNRKGRSYISDFVDKMSFGSYNNHFKPCKTPFDWLSRDEANNQLYTNDEYCGMKFTVSFFKDLTNGFLTINRNFELVSNELPIFIFSGSEDPVGNYGKGTTKLYKKYQKTGVKDLTLKLYDGGRHEMLNEINKDEVFNDVINWINNHSKK